ncbi:MAG: isopenicillin N synthase family oxygenase [Deltaproteobacteria bacterium]|nr:isopenicillin N synthase family oxygenase [Deltaproteobacteria bacterium]
MDFMTPVDFHDVAAPEKFAQSLVDTGFGVLTNHGIAHALIDQVYDEWRSFFASAEKAKYTYTTEEQAGYFPFRSENAKGSAYGDLKEFYHYYPWWDHNPIAQMQATLRYYDQITEMAFTLLEWVEAQTPAPIRKGLTSGFAAMAKDSPKTFLRILHYPPLSGAEKDGEIRAAAHEDINLLTLLPAATHPGLQVRNRQGHWFDVPCDPGNIVVNIADMLQEASAGYYPSTTHRVLKPTGEQAKQSRYSLPLFLHAKPEVQLSERYTAKAYLNERLREIGLM